MNMFDKLFQRLTAFPRRGDAAFAAVVTRTRDPDWYRSAGIADSVDGRFGLLATLTALVIVRLETLDEDGRDLSVALTEQFIAAMEAEHREFGLGDPTLGKTVRKLVAMLARRVELWRSATGATGDWTEVARDSLSTGQLATGSAGPATELAMSRLRAFWEGLKDKDVTTIAAGDLS